MDWREGSYPGSKKTFWEAIIASCKDSGDVLKENECCHKIHEISVQHNAASGGF
jgi:hypothetical protein